MDSLEVNKALAAILVAGVAWMGVTLISDGVVHPTLLEKTAIKIEGVPAAGEGQAPKQEQEPPVALLLQTASAQTGESDAQKFCSTCHNFKEGAGAKVGPDLYGVLGRPVASKAGFDYSSALKSHKGPWTYDELYQWLKKPSAYAPGTKMSFAGIENPKQRADVIAYLRTLSPHPEPLPPPPKAAPAQPAAAAAAPNPAATEATLLHDANVQTGESDAQKYCAVCHNFKEGAGPKIGPDLYGVVGRPVASKQGFDYSAALKKHSGPWTYAELFQWLQKPAAYAPGTKMTFAGIESEKQRANVIAWLRTLSPHPEPLPAVPAAQPAAAPAQGSATQGNAAQGNTTQKGNAGAAQPSAETAPAAVTPEGPQSGALLNAPQTKANQANMPPIEHIVPGSPSGNTANAPAPAANTMPTTAGSGQGNNTTQPAK